MAKYVCNVCGWVYDPAEHDGVEFKDLPEDLSMQILMKNIMMNQNFVKQLLTQIST